MTTGNRSGFSSKQAAHLQKLGLLSEQIVALAKILPNCRAVLSNPAPMSEVRGKLKAMVKALHQARKIAAGSSLASIEARNRLELSAGEIALAQIEAWSNLEHAVAVQSAPPPDPLNEQDIVSRLNDMLKVAENALRSLPPTQRRSNSASPLPIGYIERALLQGFIDHHGAGRFPPYELRTSVTKPPFPEICALVYEAIGATNEVPERAIKSYIALKRRQSRRNANIQITVGLNKRRPQKSKARN